MQTRPLVVLQTFFKKTVHCESDSVMLNAKTYEQYVENLVKKLGPMFGFHHWLKSCFYVKAIGPGWLYCLVCTFYVAILARSPL